MSSNFWDLLQGARGAQNYDFSRMRAQFLLCLWPIKIPINRRFERSFFTLNEPGSSKNDLGVRYNIEYSVAALKI